MGLMPLPRTAESPVYEDRDEWNNFPEGFFPKATPVKVWCGVYIEKMRFRNKFGMTLLFCHAELVSAAIYLIRSY